MQIQESKVRHVHQTFPRKGSENIPIHPQFIQSVKSTETVGAEGGERVEGYPEILQAAEVMKGFTGDAADGGFLDAEFGGVRGKVVWDDGEVRVVTQDTPMKTHHTGQAQSAFVEIFDYASQVRILHFEIIVLNIAAI